MRKNLFFIGSLLLSLTLMTGCDKEESASPVSVNLAKTATLKGYIHAEQDLTNSKTERVPAGKQLTVRISNSSLSIDGSGSGYWTKDVVTDANGTFTVEVPTLDKGVTVYVLANAFEGQIKQSGDAAAKNAIFYAGQTSMLVFPNDDAAISYTYSYDYIGNN